MCIEKMKIEYNKRNKTKVHKILEKITKGT